MTLLHRLTTFTLALGLCAMSISSSAQSPRLDQNAADALAALDDTVTLRFLNALDGTPIAQALVRFEGETRRTDAEGAVRFPEPAGLGDDETRVATFEHPKFVSTKAPVRFLLGKVFFNRYSISPTLPPGRIRVVLDWRAKPADLDAHLIRDGHYHLSYRDMRHYKDQAWLDRDDQDGFGPETVSVLRLDTQGRYTYRVHDYTHRAHPMSLGLSQSRAHVRVYSEQGLIKTFIVPEGIAGNSWHVFDVKDGDLRAVNRISTTP